MIILTNGFPQGPDSLIVPNGSISFQLNVDATVIAAPGGFVAAAQEVVFQFDSTGHIQPNSPAVAAQIYSNRELNPQLTPTLLGTYYLVTFYDANGARINKSPMWWQFPEVASSTVDISLMVPVSTVGGNVIFYPTAFVIPPPTATTLGGIFSNAGTPGFFISAINTDGTVSLSPAVATPAGATTNVQVNILGSLYGDSGFTYNNSTHAVAISGALTAGGLATVAGLTSSALITAQANIHLGVAGSLSGVLTMEGSTTGACTITAPAIAGTITNPITFSNAISIPSGTTYQINGTQIAASNLSNGVTGSGAVVLAVSPTITGTLTTSAISATTIVASGLITAQANIQLGVAGSLSGVITLEGSTSGAATITAPAVAGVITNPVVFSNAISAPSALFTNFTVSGSIISKYNNIATVRGGVPIFVASSLLTAQVAAITATTIYAIPVSQAGMYRITYVATVTTADGVSSALGGTTGFQIKFTNANGDAIVKTSNPTTANVSAIDATGTTISGTVTGYAAASTNLQYLFGYTSNTPGNMHYDLAIYVEYLG